MDNRYKLLFLCHFPTLASKGKCDLHSVWFYKKQVPAAGNQHWVVQQYDNRTSGANCIVEILKFIEM